MISKKAIKVFGINSKKARKLLIENNKPAVNVLFSNMKHYTDYNILFSYYNVYTHRECTKLLKYKKSLNLLRKIMTPTKILKVLSEPASPYVENDTYSMLSLLYKKDKKLFFKLKKRKIKNINNLHCETNKLLKYTKYEDFSIPQPKLIKFNNKNVDGYDIVVPTSKHELLKIGDIFNFCIGTHDYYSNCLLSKRYGFLALFKNRQPVAGVFIDHNENIIEEAHGISNDLVDFQVRQFCRSNILKIKDINIQVNSSWIDSFVYEENSKLLSIFTKKGASYSYKNVPIELISELEASYSKGSFYIQNIKGKFKRA